MNWLKRLWRRLTTPALPKVQRRGKQYPASWDRGPSQSQINSAIAITMAQLAAEGRPIGLSEAQAASIAVYQRRDYYGRNADLKSRLINNLPVRQRGEVSCS